MEDIQQMHVNVYAHTYTPVFALNDTEKELEKILVEIRIWSLKMFVK